VNPFRLPVERPVATSMFFLAVVLLGVVGWSRIPVELMPPLTGDRIFVNFARPGSDPEVVERELLLPLAASAARLEGVEESWGEVRGSSGSLQVRFLPGTDLKIRELELRRRATELAREQPPGTSVRVGAQDFAAVSRFVLMMQVTGMEDADALYDFVDERIRPRLASVSGVAQVLPTGGAGREITVRIDTDRAAAVGVDPTRVTSALVAAVQRQRFLGGLDAADSRTAVVLDGRPGGTLSLGEIRIDDRRGVLLRHVAEIERGTGLQQTLFRIDGKPAVGLMVFKEEGTNLVRLGRELRTRLDELSDEFREAGIGFLVSFDAAELVEDQLDRLERLALTGFLIALAVLYVFLRQWRAVAVVAVAVPVSLLGAAALLYLLGLSLNLVTLFGLAVGIGMLVDNSIVVYEAVQRQLERGAGPDDAAERGVRRTARAIVAASATNAVVFLPIAFLAIEDVTIRTLVRILALAIVIPLGASLLVAVGLVPLLARRLAAPAAIARIDRVRVRRERLAGWMPPDRAREVFSGVLKLALRRPGGWISVIALAVVFTVVVALPLVAFGLASQEAPRSDTVLMSVRLPSGGSLDAAGEAFAALEAAVGELDGIDHVESFVQEDGGSLNVYLVDEADRPEDLTAARVRETVRGAATRFPGVDVLSTDPGGGGMGGGDDMRGQSGGLQGQTPTEVVLSGPDFQRLNALGRELETRLRAIPDVGSVRVSARPGNEEYRVYPDPSRLAAFGLTGDQVLPLLRNVRREGVDLRIGFVLPDGREIPMTVRREEPTAAVRDDLSRMPIPTASGILPLAAVADVRRMPGEPAIQHHDGRREISVFYSLGPEAPQTGPARAALEDRIAATLQEVHRPTGYVIETPDPDEGFAWFRKLLVPVVLLLFALLAITFESLTLPVLVLLSLPLTVLGSTWGMALSDTPAGPMALAGALALIGLTVNPAILLVDRMQQRVRTGSTSAGAAALAAVRERTRPVLMTAATTLAGLWPLAISTGRDNELWPPFAVVVMGGLLSSAALTLLMIPVGFVILHRLDRLFGRLGPWVVIGWAGATGAIMTPLIRADWITTTTWRILTTTLVAALLLGVAALVFRRPERREPVADGGPPVLETRFLTKIYGRPGPVGRAWRVTDRFVRRVLAMGGTPFEPVESRGRIVPLALAATGLGYLATTVTTRFWAIVFAYVTAAMVALAIREIRRARGRVDEVGRARPGGPEGWAAAACPWLAFAWIARGVVTEGDVSTQGWVGLGLLAAATAIVQFGRRTARRVAGGEIPETLAAGRLKRARSWWRKWARKGFGLDLPPNEVRAVRSVSLRFETGMIGVLGPNGAGKTTFLRIVAGILDPSVGTVHLGGVPLDEVRAVLARWVGYLPQDFGLPADLTAREYLDYWALLYEIPEEDRTERVRSLLEEVGLGERADDRIGSFSGGMRQRVAVARTLLRLPPVIIVDEPTVGLDPRERIRFRNLLSRLARGRVVLFSTHVVEDVAVACQRVVVMARGRLVFDGEPAGLADHARGKVWEVRLLAEERDDLDASARIVDEVPEPAGTIRLRVLADASPHASARAVEPTLEDGYFVLAGSRREFEGEAA